MGTHQIEESGKIAGRVGDFCRPQSSEIWLVYTMKGRAIVWSAASRSGGDCREAGIVMPVLCNSTGKRRSESVMQSMRRRDCMSRERPQADYKKRLTASGTASRRVKCDWPASLGVVHYKRSVPGMAADYEENYAGGRRQGTATKRIP